MSETTTQSPADRLLEIVRGLKSPKFRNERQAIRFMNELLSIHLDIVAAGKVQRKVRRRIKRAWKHELPYDLYEQLGFLRGIEARHVKLIVETP